MPHGLRRTPRPPQAGRNGQPLSITPPPIIEAEYEVVVDTEEVLAKRQVLDLDEMLKNTEIVDIDTLRPHPSNPRLGDAEKIGRSLNFHGQFRAIGISQDDYILFGNHTYYGAMEVGRKRMLVHRLPLAHDDPQALEIMHADNAASDGASYDEGILKTVLETILNEQGSLEGALGDEKWLEKMIKQEAQQGRTDPDDTPAKPRKPKTKAGDIWILGDHRVACGSSDDREVLKRLAGSERFDMVITSPPYNVGKGYDQHDDKEVPWEAYGAFLAENIANWKPYLQEGRAVVWNIGVSPRTYHNKQHDLLERLGFEHERTLIWQKVGVPLPLWYNTRNNPQARQFTPNYTYELVLVFSHGGFKKGGEVEFDDTLENDVFQIGSQDATYKDGSGNRSHPAAYPVAVPRAFINHFADEEGIVFDPFLGSGSTLIACQMVNRVAYGCELDPGYVDVICRRYQEFTGTLPMLAATRKTVDFIAEG